jgi:hypothetical protein
MEALAQEGEGPMRVDRLDHLVLTVASIGATVEEVVPSSVELRWRSHDRQAAFTV